MEHALGSTAKAFLLLINHLDQLLNHTCSVLKFIFSFPYCIQRRVWE